MREIWQHGSVAATMAIYHSPYRKYSDLENIMLYGGVYHELGDGATKVPPTFHAVKIVGWGETEPESYYDPPQPSVKYWKVANSWGASYSSGASNSWGDSYTRYYPEDGYFRIKRGSNFCGIESSICFASALDTTPKKHQANASDWMAQLAEASSAVPGAYISIPDPAAHAGVQDALSHYVAHSPHTAAASRRVADYTLVHVGLQSAHGVNYHLKLTTPMIVFRREASNRNSHISNRNSHIGLEAVVHRDMGGNHHITSDQPPRAVSVSLMEEVDEPNAAAQIGGVQWWVWCGVGVAVAAAFVALFVLSVAIAKRRPQFVAATNTGIDGIDEGTGEIRARSSSGQQVIELRSDAGSSGVELEEDSPTEEVPTMATSEDALRSSGMRLRTRSNDGKGDWIPTPDKDVTVTI